MSFFQFDYFDRAFVLEHGTTRPIWECVVCGRRSDHLYDFAFYYDGSSSGYQKSVVRGVIRHVLCDWCSSLWDDLPI